MMFLFHARGRMSDPTEPPPREPSDQTLARARAGDNDALGRLLERHHRYLTFLARSGLHGHLAAKVDPADVAQEACLAAHRGITSFQGETAEAFRGWLHGILRNVLAMHVRAYLGTEKRDAKLERRLDQSISGADGFLKQQIVANQTSPSGHVMRRESSLELAEAIESLPDHYRQVIIGRHVDDESFAEIAQRMGRTVDSVEKLWVRALAKLRHSVDR